MPIEDINNRSQDPDKLDRRRFIEMFVGAVVASVVASELPQNIALAQDEDDGSQYTLEEYIDSQIYQSLITIIQRDNQRNTLTITDLQILVNVLVRNYLILRRMLVALDSKIEKVISFCDQETRTPAQRQALLAVYHEAREVADFINNRDGSDSLYTQIDLLETMLADIEQQANSDRVSNNQSLATISEVNRARTGIAELRSLFSGRLNLQERVRECVVKLELV